MKHFCATVSDLLSVTCPYSDEESNQWIEFSTNSIDTAILILAKVGPGVLRHILVRVMKDEIHYLRVGGNDVFLSSHQDVYLSSHQAISDYSSLRSWQQQLLVQQGDCIPSLRSMQCFFLLRNAHTDEKLHLTPAPSQTHLKFDVTHLL